MKAMKGMKGTEERRSPKAARPLSAAAALLAVLLAATAGYTAARYVTESDATLSAVVDAFEVTSAITYEDAWGKARAFDGNLGTMVIPTGGIHFTITIKNESAMAVNCSLTLNDGYKFTDSFSHNVSGTDPKLADEKTLTIGPIPTEEERKANDAEEYMLLFYVVRDDTYTFDEDGYYDGVDVYTRDLEITVTYTQAE